jgi:hypothetical protein
LSCCAPPTRCSLECELTGAAEHAGLFKLAAEYINGVLTVKIALESCRVIRRSGGVGQAASARRESSGQCSRRTCGIGRDGGNPSGVGGLRVAASRR